MRILLCFILLYAGRAFAEAVKFPVSDIPQDLIKNADMVIRESQATFTIMAKDEARYKVKKAYTILNEEAKAYALAYVFYDNLRKVVDFSGAVYDAEGELIRKLKRSDIYDRSAVSGFSLYEDTRVQLADLSTGKYPYTVVFEYEVKYKYLFQVPPFIAVPNEKVAVQESALSLVFPSAMAPRYKTINVSVQPIQSKDDNGMETISWHFENIGAMKAEPFGLSLYETVPQIMLAPTQFEFDGYVGKMDTWDNFGKWINLLNQGRDQLPEETKLKVQQLTAGLHTTREKVKRLYEYMQNKTRYVSIQLGIGGFQPFEAAVVDQMGYGDCKALSNYMVALLQEAGIKGYYSLVSAGENAFPIQADFPSSQFNHVIVAVPDEQDTLWLECTSQTNPFGYLGKFTNDRYALMILDHSAKLVKTPSYEAEQNVQARTAEVLLRANGKAEATVSTTYSGLQYENGHLHLILNQYDEQKKWINQYTDIPSFDLMDFEVSHTKDIIPSAKIDLTLSIPKLATVNGKRIFLTPNLMNRNTFVPEADETRKTDIIVKMGWTDFDTIRYHLPEQLYPEFLPEPIHITSIFGSYDASFSIEEGMLIYQRKMKVLAGRFSPDHYEALRKFYQNIKKADHGKVVFLNKT